MDYIKNFKEFKILLENNRISYSGYDIINEAYTNPKGGTAVAKSTVELSIEPPYYGVPADVLQLKHVAKFNSQLKKRDIKSRVELDRVDDNNQTITAIINGIFTRNIFGAAIDKRKEHKDFFKNNDLAHLIKEKNSSNMWNAWMKFIVANPKKFKLQLMPAKEFEVKVNKNGAIFTIGQIKSSNTLGPNNKPAEENISNFHGTVNYMNSVNLLNFNNGYQDYYNLETNGINDDGRLDISNTTTDYRQFYLYAGEKSQVSGISTKETEGQTTTVGASAGKDGVIEIKFQTGEHTLDAVGKKIDVNYPDIQAEAKKILAVLGEKEYVDKMELVSSASPEWNTKLQTMELYKKEGKPTSGNSDPGPGSDYASNNAKLAYDRGNYLAMLLKSALGDRIDGAISISWKISTDEPNGGKHAKYTWSKASNPGKTFTTPAGKVSSGSDKTTQQGRDMGLIYGYEVKFLTHIGKPS